MPAFQQGQLSFEHPVRLAAVLNEVGGRDAVTGLKMILESTELDTAVRMSAISAILAVGDSEDLAEYGFNRQYFTRKAIYIPSFHAHALTQLIRSAGTRDVRPSGDIVLKLRDLFSEEDTSVKSAALRLADFGARSGHPDVGTE